MHLLTSGMHKLNVCILWGDRLDKQNKRLDWW